MKAVLFFTFLVSLAKAGLWISIGILIKSHFDTVLSLIIRKPIPEGLIQDDTLAMTKKVIEWIGIILMVIGVCIAITALGSMISSFRIPMNNFNFKF